MFENMKRQIQSENLNEIITESTRKQKNDDQVKGIFLDDLASDVLGAETDPEIADLIATIPEYEDTDPSFEAKIETLTEQLIETDI